MSVCRLSRKRIRCTKEHKVKVSQTGGCNVATGLNAGGSEDRARFVGLLADVLEFRVRQGQPSE